MEGLFSVVGVRNGYQKVPFLHKFCYILDFICIPFDQFTNSFLILWVLLNDRWQKIKRTSDFDEVNGWAVR